MDVQHPRRGNLSAVCTVANGTQKARTCQVLFLIWGQVEGMESGNQAQEFRGIGNKQYATRRNQ